MSDDVAADIALTTYRPEPLLELPLKIRINNLAGDYIGSFYPTHKQMNTLLEGSEEEIATMKAFIKAVRDWSNGESPDYEELKKIVP